MVTASGGDRTVLLSRAIHLEGVLLELKQVTRQPDRTLLEGYYSTGMGVGRKPY